MNGEAHDAYAAGALGGNVHIEVESMIVGPPDVRARRAAVAEHMERELNEALQNPRPRVSTHVDPPQRRELRWVYVDLDGTLAEPVWTPENPTSAIGMPIRRNVAKLDDLRRMGYTIIVYTSRPWTDHESIMAWAAYHDVPITDVQCGKPLGALYVDDRGRHESAESWLP